MTTRVRAVRRRNVVIGAVIAAAFVAGVVVLSEGLRHPHPAGAPIPELEEPSADPRIEVSCPEPPPLGGSARDDEAARTAPVQVSSSDLHECPASYDRVRVAFQGEAVGAVLRRRDGAWVRLNDDVYAGARGPLPAHRDYRGGNDGIGVFLPHEVADRIRTVGGPHRRGDVLAITGTFHRVDPDSREVIVVLADDGDVVRDGEPFEDVRLPDREIAAGILAAVALALVARERVHAIRWWRG